MSGRELLEDALAASALARWNERVNAVCDAVYLRTGAEVRCYMLDLQDGSFELVYPATEGSQRLPFEVRDRIDAATPLIAAAYTTMEPVGADGDGQPTSIDSGDADRTIFAVTESSTPVVLIELSTPQRSRLSRAEIELIRVACQPLSSAYSLRRTSTFYREIVRPLDFDGSFEEFTDGLGGLLLAASGMEFAALRQIRNSDLELVDAWGFDASVEQRALSWPVDKYAPFESAASGQIAWVQDVSAKGLAEIRTIPGLGDIQSFIVAPVAVGGEVFGVLSCAARCPYEFTAMDEQRIEALGNTVGVALANYRNVNGSNLNLTDLTDLSVTATTAEVAHAARHEVQALADTAGAIARHLQNAKPGPTRDEDFQRLERVLLDISPAIDKIRIASRPIKYVKQERSLASEWEDVVDLLQGRLAQESIQSARSGPDVRIPLIEDLFRQVFLHLVLNSIDAFRGRGVGMRRAGKSGRLVRLDIVRPSSKANTVSFRYSDNATGISPPAVRVRTSADEDEDLPRIVRDRRDESAFEVDDLPIAERIFRPNVTSKGRAGSGWGLYLVRRILDEHGGTINLTNYRNGVTFTISLPRGGGEDLGGGSN